MTWVVDASVAVKWVVPEVLTDEAEQLLAGDEELVAPDLIEVEAANALWKKTVRREMSAAEADGALELLRESGLVLRPTGPLLPRAMRLAHRLGHPIYACVYLALAEREGARLVTADGTLAGRLRSKRLGARVVELRTLAIR